MPRTIEPQRRPPQGPVPTPVRLLTCSKVLAPAWMALSTVPLRILLHRQAGLRFSMIACSLAFRSSSSMTELPSFASFGNHCSTYFFQANYLIPITSEDVRGGGNSICCTRIKPAFSIQPLISSKL